MSNEKLLTLIRKSLQENQAELNLFDERESKLGEQEHQLLTQLESEEKIVSRTNILTRQIEEAIVNGEQARAQELKKQISDMQEHSKSTKVEIKKLGEAIEAVRGERKTLVKGILYQVHPSIKEKFAATLEAAIRLHELEIDGCAQVAGEAGIVLPGSFSNELRIFAEGSRGGSRDWRPLRDKLDRWLP